MLHTSLNPLILLPTFMSTSNINQFYTLQIFTSIFYFFIIYTQKYSFINFNKTYTANPYNYLIILQTCIFVENTYQNFIQKFPILFHISTIPHLVNRNAVQRSFHVQFYLVSKSVLTLDVFKFINIILFFILNLMFTFPTIEIVVLYYVRKEKKLPNLYSQAVGLKALLYSLFTNFLYIFILFQ